MSKLGGWSSRGDLELGQGLNRWSGLIKRGTGIRTLDAGAVEQDFRAKVLASRNLGFVNTSRWVVTYGSLSGGSGGQEYESLGGAHEALPCRVQHQGQFVDLIVANYGADFGAHCLHSWSIPRIGHFFVHATRF